MTKPKSIQNIEKIMDGLEPGSLRFSVLDCARQFKTSWIELGQHLFSIYKDKHYKEWGYLTFEAYCAKEIGVRQNTALKLLKSYSFLEREEPEFLKLSKEQTASPKAIPSVEAVNSLRLAKGNQRIPEEDYEEIRTSVLEDVKPEEEVRQKIKYVLKANPSTKEKETADPIEQKNTLIRKLTNGLNQAKSDCLELEFPQKIIKQIDALVDLLADYQS